MKNPEIIIEITIVNSNLNDITKLCDSNLVNLEKLYLLENSITNIKPLLRAKFTKIKSLGFGRNKIGDENIPYLLEMKFDQLEELNLYSNNLTDCKIFNLQSNQNLPNLKIFYIGNNRIDWIKRNSIDRAYNFKNLITIGLTSGIFDDKTIENINSFDFSNLKIIYLSRCDIHSLDFVNKLELPCIEEFYINTTFINEFYPLSKYKYLKIIEMRDNYIENIDNLKSFIEELPKLKQINIKGNNIDMNLEENKAIIESIKQIKNKPDIII
jgi:Leucine-rich repeat (LRR) protein